MSFPARIHHFLDFKTFLAGDTGSRVANEISQFYEAGLTSEQVVIKRQAALDADNKTKSSDADIDVPREAFWSKKAERLYKDMGFLDVEAMLGYLK